MTVKELINDLSRCNPDMEVKITSGPFISKIDNLRLVTDIDTNIVSVCIYGDRDVFAKYENFGPFAKREHKYDSNN